MFPPVGVFVQRCIYGTCEFALTLKPLGTWAVYGERDTVKDPKNPSKTKKKPILLCDSKDGPVLLPASSLKGVIRSTAERILRSMDPARDLADIPLADTTFVSNDELQAKPRGAVADSDLDRWREANGEQRFSSAEIYGQLSPASQMFGATVHAGLVTIDDAALTNPAVAERPHAAIDRFTGAVANLFFQPLVTEQPSLCTRLTITNFALWQVGLLGLVFREINRGYQGIGSGTHKGQGRFQIETTCISARYSESFYGQRTAGFISAQAWAGDAPAAAQNERHIVLLENIAAEAPNDWRDAGLKTVSVTGDQVAECFRAAVAGAWVPWLEAMKRDAA